MFSYFRSTWQHRIQDLLHHSLASLTFHILDVNLHDLVSIFINSINPQVSILHNIMFRSYSHQLSLMLYACSGKTDTHFMNSTFMM